MFERFTDDAVEVILLAQDEARRLGHNFVGTEHILLGLLGRRNAPAAVCLRTVGINLSDARKEIENETGRGTDSMSAEIPLTDHAKQLFEFTFDEMKGLGNKHIGTEHLLLGLTRVDDGVAARILIALGTQPAIVRSKMIRMLGEGKVSFQTESKVSPPTELDGHIGYLSVATNSLSRLKMRIPLLIETYERMAQTYKDEAIPSKQIEELNWHLEQFDAALREDVPGLRESIAILRERLQSLIRGIE
jgi:ATP-dependent Clp protease ATP-binding subunit ClpA